MDLFKEVLILRVYVEELEKKIKQDHGDKPAIHVWLQNCLLGACTEAEKTYKEYTDASRRVKDER